MLAFLSVPAITQTEVTDDAPSLPTFRPRWWYRADRLDARPVAWSLRNRPQDWAWQNPGYTLRHKPSSHVFWVANGAAFARLYEADCSCSSTRGRFQRFQARFVFWRAFSIWRRNHQQYDPQHFAAHFVRAQS